MRPVSTLGSLDMVRRSGRGHSSVQKQGRRGPRLRKARQGGLMQLWFLGLASHGWSRGVTMMVASGSRSAAAGAGVLGGLALAWQVDGDG